MLNDVYSLRFVIRVGTEFCFSQLHYIETTASDFFLPADQLSVAFDLVHFDNIRDVLSGDCSLVETYTRRIYPTPHIPSSWGGEVNGIHLSDPLPPLSPCVLTWYTDLFSRSGRGRTYISGLPVFWQDAGVLTNLGLSALQGLADAFANTTLQASGADPGEWKLAVWSPRLQSAGLVIAQNARPNLARLGTRRARPQTA